MTVLHMKQQVTIDTVVPTLSLGQIQISADRRSTKDKPLSDKERIRRVVLPSDAWGELSSSVNGERNQSLTDLLRTALVTVASDRLRDILATEPMQRLVELSDFTVPALLAWNEETASSRGSITFTREQVETWFAASVTKQHLATRLEGNSKRDGLLALVGTRFATLAAKNHGLRTVDDANKLLALIEPEDLDGTSASLVTELVGRLEHIKKMIAAKVEDNISMSDLILAKY